MGDSTVCLAADRWFAHVDGQLTIGTDLDKGTLAAAGLDPDDYGVGYSAKAIGMAITVTRVDASDRR